MRLSLFAAAAALVVSSLAAAHADTYSIVYTGTRYGTGPNQRAQTVGSFNYDGSTFSDFVISLGGQNFDFTQQANQEFVEPYISNLCLFNSTFQFLTATGACSPGLYAGPYTFLGPHHDFVYFVTSDPVFPGVTQIVAEVDQPFSASFPYLPPAKVSVIDESTATSLTPEPSSFALLGTGMLGIAGVVRKRFA